MHGRVAPADGSDSVALPLSLRLHISRYKPSKA